MATIRIKYRSIDDTAPASLAVGELAFNVISGKLFIGDDTGVFDLLSAGNMPTGISASNISTGLVSNTEFNFLNGVTSTIQTQLDSKAANSHTHILANITDAGNSAGLDVGTTVGTVAAGEHSHPGGDGTLDGLSDTTIIGELTNDLLYYSGLANGWRNMVPGNLVLNTTNFDGILSGADTSLQLALDTIDDISAAVIPFTAIGTIAAATVQLAIQELDSEKLADGGIIDGGTF